MITESQEFAISFQYKNLFARNENEWLEYNFSL